MDVGGVVGLLLKDSVGGRCRNLDALVALGGRKSELDPRP